MSLSARQADTTYWLRLLIDAVDEKLIDRQEVLRIVDCGRLIGDPLVYVDIGARGGIPSHMREFASIISVIQFEPDPEEFRKLQLSTVATRNRLLPYAVGAHDGPSTLYLTKKRACSSLLEPHGFMSDLLAASVNGGGTEYGDTDRFNVEQTVVVECRRLTSALSGVTDEIDILKIDTQGLEFEVLQQIGTFRPFAINVECSTTDLYKNQNTFFEVGSFLRNLGYFPGSLIDPHLVPKRGQTMRRPIPLHGDCLFFPDLSDLGRKIIARDPLKWVTAVAAHGHFDLARWQAARLAMEVLNLR